MPNWIRNRLMVGRVNAMQSIVENHVREDENGNRNLDFNTIIKRPSDLDMTVGSRSEDGTKIYLTMADPSVNFTDSPYKKLCETDLKKIHRKTGLQKPLSLDEYQKMIRKYEDEFLEVAELGKKACDNILKYGYANWYTWSIAKWGTKWNACGTEVSEDKTTMEFETAWDPPIPAIVELSKQHPGVKMALVYSDEDIGNHVGYMLLTAGHIDFQGTFPDQSEDAYKLAFDLWGCRDSFRWDGKKQTFVPIQEEHEMCL